MRRREELMDRQGWLDWLKNVKARVRTDVPLRDRTSYRIGGTADT